MQDEIPNPDIPTLDFEVLLDLLEQPKPTTDLPLEVALLERKKQIDKLTGLLKEQSDQLYQNIKKICNHPNGLETHSSYFSGSYTETAHTEYWDKCPICGLVTNKRIKTHGWYG